VPLPVQFGGQEQSLLQFPLEGTLVELGFAFERAEVFSRTDTVGNLSRHTDQLSA
jgi:hypothetical protein